MNEYYSSRHVESLCMQIFCYSNTVLHGLVVLTIFLGFNVVPVVSQPTYYDLLAWRT